MSNPAPNPTPEASGGKPAKGRAISGKLKIAGIIVGVVAVEWVVAYLYLPSSAPASPPAAHGRTRTTSTRRTAIRPSMAIRVTGPRGMDRPATGQRAMGLRATGRLVTGQPATGHHRATLPASRPAMAASRKSIWANLR